MHPVVGQCPICGGELTVTRLRCDDCDVSIEGRFSLGRLAQLTPEQLAFVETFIRCEGKINRVEAELGISYPTVRARLDDVIVALGYQPISEVEEEAAVSEETRKRILGDLAEGRITSEEAVTLLRGE